MAIYKGKEIRQKVTRLSQGVFKVTWQHKELVPQQIILDFKPLIRRCYLEIPFVLIHWQARPKFLRRWGLYDGSKDEYFGADCDQVELLSLSQPNLLQIDEKKVSYPPTAVIHYPLSFIEYNGVSIKVIKKTRVE